MRDETSVDTESLFREPLDDVGAGHHLALRLGDRLALFLRQQQGDVAGALAQQGGGLAHDPAAGRRGEVAPCRKAALRREQRPIEIGAPGMRDLADHPARRRIVHGKRPTIDGVMPTAVNEELRIEISHVVPLERPSVRSVIRCREREPHCCGYGAGGSTCFPRLAAGQKRPDNRRP